MWDKSQLPNVSVGEKGSSAGSLTKILMEIIGLIMW